MASFKYLHEINSRTFYFDNKLVPEVRAMFSAMASRMPAGGVKQRYSEVVESVAKSIEEEKGDSTRVKPGAEGPWRKMAEDRLCEYPLHPRVQEFFDKFVKMYGHCYDAETEVLCEDTTAGGMRWIRWPDAVGQNHLKVAAFDPNNDAVRFEKPLAWVEKPYTGRMYRLKKERGNVDLLVTPEHKMLVRKKECVGGGRGGCSYEWSAWRGVPATEVANKTMYRYKRGASRYGNPQPIPPEADPWGLTVITEQGVSLHAFGRLCGFFVGDGYAGGKQASYLSFNLRKEREISFLAQLEKDLDLRVLRHANGQSHISLAGARDWARRFFYDEDKNKCIPAWVMHAPEDFVRGFMAGLLNSDGSTVTEESWSYASSSRKVLEGLQILGTLWGTPVSVRGPYDDKGVQVAFVSGPRCLEPVVNRGCMEDGWVDYDGKVYCATVSTGFLVVRRNNATMISGNSSIMELTGSPAVFIEGISWWTAYKLFDNPLCAGQEFSTRAVRHKDWPICREAFDIPATPEGLAKYDKLMAEAPTLQEQEDARVFKTLAEIAGEPHPGLMDLHERWLTLFEAEVKAWAKKLKDPEVRAGLGIADKEPFRPALDRARWAIPGTIATGCSHTANLRVMARTIRDGQALAANHGSKAAQDVWEDIRKAYREALPGLADMGLREAVYDAEYNIPGHLRPLFVEPEDTEDDVWIKIHTNGAADPLAFGRSPGAKAYIDPSFNQAAQVDVGIRQSLAVSRDWHRHRTFYPWRMYLVRPNDGTFRIHHLYEPLSKHGRENLEQLLTDSTALFDEFLEANDYDRAMLCLPLGTQVEMVASGGLRDAIYMFELRGYAHGANFEYKQQALDAIEQIREQIAHHDALSTVEGGSLWGPFLGYSLDEVSEEE